MQIEIQVKLSIYKFRENVSIHKKISIRLRTGHYLQGGGGGGGGVENGRGDKSSFTPKNGWGFGERKRCLLAMLKGGGHNNFWDSLNTGV